MQVLEMVERIREILLEHNKEFPNLTTDYILETLNSGQELVVDELYHKAEETQFTIDGLNKITVTLDAVVTNNKLTLPPDYRHKMFIHITTNNVCELSEGFTQVKLNDLDKRRGNTFTKEKEGVRGLYSIYNNIIHFNTEQPDTVTNVSLVYVKNPKRLTLQDVTKYQGVDYTTTCELDEFVHNMIVNKAIEIITNIK